MVRSETGAPRSSVHRGTTGRRISRRAVSSLALSAAVALALGACESQVSPQPGPSPSTTVKPARRTSFGFAVWAHPGENYAAALKRQSAALGTPEVIRYFYGERPLVWPVEGGVTGRTPLIVSFKRPPAQVRLGRYDAEISDWLRSLPRDRPTWIAYEHEMDAKVAGGEYLLEDAKAAYIRVAKLIADTDNPELKSTLILTGYQYRVRLGELWPGAEYVDVLGVDTYRWEQESLDWLLVENLDVARHYRKPLGLSEFGLNTGSDEARAAFLTQAIKRGRGVYVWMAYFDANRSDVLGDRDWEISDLPRSAAVWQRATRG
mgnify:CR=1 FL=1